MKQTNLLKYIYAQRWCNFKEDITQGNVIDIELNSTPFNNGKKFFILGKAIIKNKKDKFFIMPLSKGKLENEIPLKYKRFDVVDALKVNDYWSAIMAEACLKNSLTISNDYSLVYQSWQDLDFITLHLKDTSKPLNAEQTNSTLMVGNKTIAFKQQRFVEFSKDINPEVEMNYHLLKAKCSVIPKTYGHLFLLSSNGENAFVGIVQEFVPNNGDLWVVLTKALYDIFIKKQKNPDDKTIKKDFNYLKKLIKKLGVKTGEMLKCLSSFKTDNALKVENIDDLYIKNYKQNLLKLSTKTKETVEKNINLVNANIKEKLSYLLNNWDKNINNFINLNINKILNRKRKGKLMRVHGDFHLGQVIITENNELKFIDFSGEPNLDFEKRKAKHPSMYDVAGMYRSINGYLEANIINKYLKNENLQGSSDKTINAYKTIHPLISELSNIFLKAQKIDKEWLNLEILRRNLYEIEYEVAYRPQMLTVPVFNLINLLVDS